MMMMVMEMKMAIMMKKTMMMMEMKMMIIMKKTIMKITMMIRMKTMRMKMMLL